MLLGCVLLALLLMYAGPAAWLPELDRVQAQVQRWRADVAAQPWLAAGGFVLLYVGVVSISLPLAPVLSLAGGALFGFSLGLALVLGARTVGATLAAIVVRRLLREVLRRRHQRAMLAFDAGVQRDGAFYLLSLRLFPAFPFVLVNILAGISSMSVRSFFWLSLLGMLPAATLQVMVGAQLF
jgi:uncharacterized membrane protein YdjX (TVP38/TMEM64 family)